MRERILGIHIRIVEAERRAERARTVSQTDFLLVDSLDFRFNPLRIKPADIIVNSGRADGRTPGVLALRNLH